MSLLKKELVKKVNDYKKAESEWLKVENEINIAMEQNNMAKVDELCISSDKAYDKMYVYFEDLVDFLNGFCGIDKNTLRIMIRGQFQQIESLILRME